jgi:adenosylhomocysteinase
MSASFTNQVLAQIELWKNSSNYKNEVYVLPKILDEEVARLHLEKVGANLRNFQVNKLTILVLDQKDLLKTTHIDIKLSSATY